MSDSIKKRMGHSHLGGMSNKELKKLFDAALADLRKVAADLANVQVVVNNIGSAVQNIKTNCSNATVNINAATLAAVSNTALTLTA